MNKPAHINNACIFDAGRLLETLSRKSTLAVGGLCGSAATIMVHELARLVPVVVLPKPENLHRYGRELRKIGDDITAIDEKNPYYAASRILISDPAVLTRPMLKVDRITVTAHQDIDLDRLIARLELTGYSREDNVEEENEYAVRGGIVDVFEHACFPVRIEFYGNKICSIRKFDTQTQRSTEGLERVTIRLACPDTRPEPLMQWITEQHIAISESDPPLAVRSIVLCDHGDIEYRFTTPRPYFGDLKAVIQDMNRRYYGFKFLVSPGIARRLRSVLGEIEIHHLPLEQGFVDEDRRIAYLTEREIFGKVKQQAAAYKGPFVDDLTGFQDNDYVVHSDYGIGQYKRLTFVDLGHKKVECLEIAYAGKDKLFLPIERMNLLERFVATGGMEPRLSRLGSELWLRTKQRVKKATERFALELLKLYARRMQEQGFAFSPETAEMKTLEATFPFEETEDQLAAINDVKRDMESPAPAERLICGDVGYGKTEIALRVSFKAALDGKQTMVLCPTTLLAFQHYNTFKKRLDPFPVSIEMVSRFRHWDDIKKILEGIAAGRVDIVIGTHRLLQPDVQFHDLGLLVVDEEQRFGVAQKEKIKKMKPGIDVIYLSATPVPRTLYMALTGLKNVSNIYTPPVGRKEIMTSIIHFDEERIEDIILREIERGGQVFFVHNRIQTIESLRNRLLKMLPDLRICVLHGRMREDVNARRMIQFLNGEYDMLLSTAIVESGIDIPRVNTIIVDQAHRFGLSDLHQLRGRVGRSGLQAYAYFITPSPEKMTEEARKRLGALVSYASLGSGFRLALRDMEIRGIGNLLGKEQSGHVHSIGFHHYIRLLSESVSELQGKPVVQEPVLDLRLDAYFPAQYIASTYERTALYKRLMEIESKPELDSVKNEIVDRFGRYPKEVDDLFLLASVRVKARALGASQVVRKAGQFIFYRAGRVIHTAAAG
ncbi:transcription-repair coupling factor [candidate division WOR-3 bacterium]|nr:transcription-repair coupling factor [candidate division WOR-3 bacterium]